MKTIMVRDLSFQKLVVIMVFAGLCSCDAGRKAPTDGSPGEGGSTGGDAETMIDAAMPCDRDLALWSDEFSTMQSRWDWAYGMGSGYRQLVDLSGTPAVEIGITDASTSSAYSDCSLHETEYGIDSGIIEMRLRYEGSDGFGTMGWGVWNYVNPSAVEAAWFYDGSSDGGITGFQAMMLADSAMAFQQHLPAIDPSDWHVYRVELSASGTRFFVDDHLVAFTPATLALAQRIEIWVDNYHVEISGNVLVAAGFFDVAQTERIFVDWVRFYDQCTN